MEGLVRRPSGVYVARLMVPKRLRPLIGKTELIETTRVRDLAVARIVGGHLLTTWRQRLLELERMLLGSEIEVLRALEGSPQLALNKCLPLADAATASGIGQEVLLRAAAEGSLELFYQAVRLPGYRVPEAALDRDVPDDFGPKGVVVPPPCRMPATAMCAEYTGLLMLDGPRTQALDLLSGKPAIVVSLYLHEAEKVLFVPDVDLHLTRADIWLSCAEVEAHRRRLARLITPEQVDAARASRTAALATVPEQRQWPLRDSIEAFLADHKKPRRREQTERVRAACRLFLELMGGDLRGAELTRDLVRRFRDLELPRVPEHENKVRLSKGSRSIIESIAAVEGTDWPRMSMPQQVKRMTWIGGWFTWLHNEGWVGQDIGQGVVGGGHAGRGVVAARKDRRSQDRRDKFSEDELQRIFSAQRVGPTLPGRHLVQRRGRLDAGHQR